jgi:hypothetical protein
MRDRSINEEQPRAYKPQQRREFHPLRERARDKGRRDNRERHLETHEHGFRDRRHEIVNGVRLEAVHHEVGEAAQIGIACPTVRKRNAVADDHP